MPSCCVRARSALALLALFVVVFPSFVLSCGGTHEKPLLPRSQTWAELRTVRRAVWVKPPGEAERAPYPRERLVDGEAVKIEAEGLAWLRRDGGATLLVRGPAELTLRAEAMEIGKGRVFVDTPAGITAELVTPAGPLHLAHVRASIDVGDAATEVYVLAGEVRTDRAARAGAGERLTLRGKGADAKAETAPALTWEDWTGGLATTDRAAEPSPYGVGTVGARKPGDQGSPRFPLAIQRLDVRVTVDRDLALTEVDEVFFNPSSEVVEGVYRFRTPDGATLRRFGVDREGAIKWGRVKEKAAAAAQYQANVYEGSTEDPALLEWDAPGVYRARLYPIGPGETRRVVVTYAEWLGRTGAKGERRLYVYPMAAEGAEASAPRIEELYATVDLAKAGAREVRVGMAGMRDGDKLVIREQDLVPRADLAVELFDDGLAAVGRGYTAAHTVDAETLPPGERAEAALRAKGEAEYLLVPVSDAVPLAKGGLDLAIVVDASAATETAGLAIARAATAALLAHAGKDDRVVVWAGDSSLRPIAGRGALAPVDEAGRRAILASLARLDRGGATDLGAMLSQAAAALDPARRGAVVYIGDGSPTVGELGLVDLRDRLAKLPRPVRIFGLGVGDGADMAILKGLARGAFAERIGDANAAARTALRVLEVAERPAFLGASVDLGPTVERIYPRDLGALVADESLVVIGRLTGKAPQEVTLNGPGGARKIAIKVAPIDDSGDMRRRWAEGRLAQMIDEGTGRAAMVDLGSRHGIITPVTSLYVPTKNEMTGEEREELRLAQNERRARRAKLPSKYEPPDQPSAAAWADDDKANAWAKRDEQAKEGGTGTRAKGEEGSMGAPARRHSEMEVTAKRPASAGGAAPAAPNASPTPDAAAAPSAMASAAGRDVSLGDSPRPMQPNKGFGGGGLATATATPALPVEEKPTEPRGRPFAELPKVKNVPETINGAIDDKPDKDGRGGKANAEVGERLAPAFVPRMQTGAKQRETGTRAPAAPGDPMGGDSGYYQYRAGADGSGLDSEGDGNTDGQKPGDDVGVLAGRIDALAKQVGDLRRGPAASDETVAFEGKERGEIQQGMFAAHVTVSNVSRFAIRCGGAAFVPFEERVLLWRERLARVTGNAGAVAQTYRRALAACEAPTWRERSKLLSMLLDAMPGVPAKVALWRTMFNDLGAADALYRGILARVRTPADARQLHDALGLKSIDPGVLAKLLKEAKTQGERVKKLRALVLEWPDDFALALKLLDALEDAGDDAAARELGRRLRARPDADARLRTAVGELYLRLAKHQNTPENKAIDEGEARRAFGEIVEFAPDDPIARRRLGDLLRAHGWFAEAARQYETLARLSPDDASVPLLLAAAAEGLGKLEEAVKWTEKGGAAGAPDLEQGPAQTARAFAATYLAWGRLAAIDGGRADEAKALATRLARVLSTERSPSEALRGTRVALTWSHPELHPTLWTNALGAAMLAKDGDVTLGIAAASMPERENAWIEVRIEADELEHTARLGAEATLTVVFDEGGPREKIVRRAVTFARDGAATKRFSLASGAVTEVRK